MIGLLLGLGCPELPGEPQTSTPASPTTSVAACGLLAGDLELPARVRPGEVVPLSPPALPDAVLSWVVTVGEVEAGQWHLPADAGVHTDLFAQATVRASRPGCADEVSSASTTLGFLEPERVVVLWNPEVAGSEEVAVAYAALRSLAPEQLCPVPTADATTLPGDDFPAFLDAVLACVDAVGPRVHYLAPVHGVPYKVTDRIQDLAGGFGTVTTSLDALLVLGAAAERQVQAGWNPLWQEGDSLAGTYEPYVPIGQWRESTGEDLWLVTRLDGATSEAALALVERAGEAQDLADRGLLAGTVYVDGRYGDAPPATDAFGSYESGEWNMWGTRTLFEGLGLFPVVWDGNEAEFGTSPAPLECPQALFYAGWYSYYNYNDAFTWQPGAVGGHLDSCSACDLRAEGTWSGTALQRGITATFGAVAEPYVAGMPEYDQLFLYLTQGATYGEAAYQSTRIGAWMMVFVGDPLYRPFPAGAP